MQKTLWLPCLLSNHVRLSVSTIPGVPVQGRPRQDHHTRRVHPHDKGHHHGDGQGGSCGQLCSAGGRYRHCQPEPQSHLWYADYLQGANPRGAARAAHAPTSPGCHRAQIGQQSAVRFAAVVAHFSGGHFSKSHCEPWVRMSFKGHVLWNNNQKENIRLSNPEITDKY